MPVKDRRVVAQTPYGREATVSVLLPYLRRDFEAGVIDEWQLWMNTDSHQQSDRDYASKIASENSFIVQKDAPRHRNLDHKKQYNTRTFFEYCDDPDSVYVRVDDDIVYVHEDAISSLVAAKIDSTSFASFPVIWNNAISTYFLQQHGSIPRDWGQVGMYCMDPVGWADPFFAERIHNLLLDNIEAGTVPSLFLYQNAQLPEGLQFSVSTFACLGEEYQITDPPGFIDHTDDEYWHTVEMPKKLGRPNMMVGTSLVSHFTFYPQRDYIYNHTNLLARYRASSERL